MKDDGSTSLPELVGLATNSPIDPGYATHDGNRYVHRDLSFVTNDNVLLDRSGLAAPANANGAA